MEPRYTVSTRLALTALAAILGFQIYEAVTFPIGGDEAYLYDRFVRPTIRQVLSSELPNRNVLYSVLEKRSVGLFHVSPFAVRLPGILFGILYLWSIWKIANALLGVGWRFAAGVMIAGALPLYFGWFAHGTGTGAAMSLLVCAISLAVRGQNLNLIGALIGLSICTSTISAIPGALVAVSMLAISRRWWTWCNQVLIPSSVVVWMVLVLPMSHAHTAAEASPGLTRSQAAHLREALDTLRASAGQDHVRIAAVATAEPIVNFYRAQHRANGWERAARGYSSGQFDYYLLSASDSDWASARHLIVLHQDADFLLARQPAAAM